MLPLGLVDVIFSFAAAVRFLFVNADDDDDDEEEEEEEDNGDEERNVATSCALVAVVLVLRFLVGFTVVDREDEEEEEEEDVFFAATNIFFFEDFVPRVVRVEEERGGTILFCFFITICFFTLRLLGDLLVGFFDKCERLFFNRLFFSFFFNVTDVVVDDVLDFAEVVPDNFFFILSL